MTSEDFNLVFEDTIQQCRDILCGKGKEYARGGNRLSNFVTAGFLQNETTVKALGGMMSKHTVSIFDYINDHEKGMKRKISQWDEKIIDHINYLLLLRAALIDALEGKTFLQGIELNRMSRKPYEISTKKEVQDGEEETRTVDKGLDEEYF